MNEHPAITATRRWLESFIIEYSICPFAGQVYEKNSIRYVIINHQSLEESLFSLITECEKLTSCPEIDTTLLIFPETLKPFNHYLDFLDTAQQLLTAQHYEGIFQLASFHPDYCFSGCTENDAANYTNRSPFPMLHIIRESSIEKVLRYYPDPENIPDNNIKLCRKMGPGKISALLKDCKSHSASRKK